MNNTFELYAAVVGLWVYLFFGILIVAWWAAKDDL